MTDNIIHLTFPCTYCGQDGANSWDHVIPRPRGGTQTVLCCRSCNSSKGSRTPEEWIAALVHKGMGGKSRRIQERIPLMVEAGLIDRQVLADLVAEAWCEADDLRQRTGEVLDQLDVAFDERGEPTWDDDGEHLVFGA